MKAFFTTNFIFKIIVISIS